MENGQTSDSCLNESDVTRKEESKNETSEVEDIDLSDISGKILYIYENNSHHPNNYKYL